MSIVSDYLQLMHGTEPPAVYFRWSMLAAIGAAVGRRVYCKHGHFKVSANLYTLLVGVPAARKSTAIKITKSLMRDAGYKYLSADRSSKEKFLMDLAGMEDELPFKSKGPKAEDLHNIDLWGGDTAEQWLVADEFAEFFTTDPVSFCRSLGNLWDFEGVYKDRIKNSRSIEIDSPYVGILGGITPQDLSNVLPPDLIGQGFFSRVILVFADPTGRKDTFPEASDTSELVSRLQQLLFHPTVDMQLTAGARRLLDKIYKSWVGLQDPRFLHYNNRRFTQVMKLCILHALSDGRVVITEQDAIESNTVLSHIETFMPKALGLFGKAKNSTVTHKIVSALDHASDVMTIKDLWALVHQDLNNTKELADVLSGLVFAERIQQISTPTKIGFLANRRVQQEKDSELYDHTLLTADEQKASL